MPTVKTKFDYEKEIDNSKNVKSVLIKSDDFLGIPEGKIELDEDGRLSFKAKNIALQGVKAIKKTFPQILVKDKHLSKELLGIMNLEIDDELGQWSLIRFEANYFNTKYKVA